jgi:prepilin-type N-terminal cleavage/methylation domain-containing protein
MSPEPSRAGFSLVESVVAVAILGLMLPLLFESIRSAVGLMSTAERRKTEWRLAENLMTEAAATLDGRKGLREGLDGDFAWSVQTMPADADIGGGRSEGDGDVLVRVRVRVRASAHLTSEVAVTLDTLRLWTAPR